MRVPRALLRYPYEARPGAPSVLSVRRGLCRAAARPGRFTAVSPAREVAEVSEVPVVVMAGARSRISRSMREVSGKDAGGVPLAGFAMRS